MSLAGRAEKLLSKPGRLLEGFEPWDDRICCSLGKVSLAAGLGVDFSEVGEAVGNAEVQLSEERSLAGAMAVEVESCRQNQ